MHSSTIVGTACSTATISRWGLTPPTGTARTRFAGATAHYRLVPIRLLAGGTGARSTASLGIRELPKWEYAVDSAAQLSGITTDTRAMRGNGGLSETQLVAFLYFWSESGRIQAP